MFKTELTNVIYMLLNIFKNQKTFFLNKSYQKRTIKKTTIWPKISQISREKKVVLFETKLKIYFHKYKISVL